MILVKLTPRDPACGHGGVEPDFGLTAPSVYPCNIEVIIDDWAYPPGRQLRSGDLEHGNTCLTIETRAVTTVHIHTYHHSQSTTYCEPVLLVFDTVKLHRRRDICCDSNLMFGYCQLPIKIVGKRILTLKHLRASHSSCGQHAPLSFTVGADLAPLVALTAHSNPSCVLHKSPSFQTPLKFSVSSILSSGLPSTNTKSAFKPSRICPRSWNLNRFALRYVAALRASAGEKPQC